MKVFEDKNNGLIWYSPELEENTRGVNATYLHDDNVVVNELHKELDSWRSENIRRYILGDKKKLGSYLDTYTKDENLQFFAYDKSGLVAVLMMKKPIPLALDKCSVFRSYIEFCEDEKKFNGEDGEMPLAKARQALLYDDFNYHGHLQYLVVAPNAQGKGIGTRVIRSVNQNREFFVGHSNHSLLSASVYYDNVASNKIMKNNDFYKVVHHDMDGTYTGFNDYYNVM